MTVKMKDGQIFELYHPPNIPDYDPEYEILVQDSNGSVFPVAIENVENQEDF